MYRQIVAIRKTVQVSLRGRERKTFHGVSRIYDDIRRTALNYPSVDGASKVVVQPLLMMKKGKGFVQKFGV